MWLNPLYYAYFNEIASCGRLARSPSERDPGSAALLEWPSVPPGHGGAGYARSPRRYPIKSHRDWGTEQTTSGRHGEDSWPGEQPLEGFFGFLMNERSDLCDEKWVLKYLTLQEQDAGLLYSRLLLNKARASSFIRVIDPIVSEAEFYCGFWQVQPSLHCTQFHQKLAFSWAQVAEILSRVRELENRICKINVFFKVSQDICYWNSACIPSLSSSNQRMRVGRKKRESQNQIGWCFSPLLPALPEISVREGRRLKRGGHSMNAVPQALDFSGSQKMEMLLFWNVFLFCNLHKVFPS